MSEHVERHYVSPEFFRSRALESEEEREQVVPLLETKSSLARPVLAWARVAFLTHLAVDPSAGDPRTRDAWSVCAEVAESLFAMSETPVRETVERVIGGRARSLPGAEGASFADAENWLTAFFLARTRRDAERLEFLCRIPVDRIRRAESVGGFVFDEYVYSWIHALQDHTLDRSTLSQNLLRAFELSDPSENPDTDGDYLRDIVFPQLNVFLRAAQLDTEEFNRGLEKGLRGFRSYYTQSPERAKDLDGVLPLGLLAVSCMAFDLGGEHSGFKPQFRSDYLPDHILARTWERLDLR
ncbi:immunity 49 family protein [Nocardiopsis sp. NPDC006938]|uniref:immunity 49 family protein n=1 Tax=Nocardiopsis sp. NPDC006938 TaxID=3364337 RepID=UPI0036821B3C